MPSISETIFSLHINNHGSGKFKDIIFINQIILLIFWWNSRLREGRGQALSDENTGQDRERSLQAWAISPTFHKNCIQSFTRTTGKCYSVIYNSKRGSSRGLMSVSSAPFYRRIQCYEVTIKLFSWLFYNCNFATFTNCNVISEGLR